MGISKFGGGVVRRIWKIPNFFLFFLMTASLSRFTANVIWTRLRFSEIWLCWAEIVGVTKIAINSSNWTNWPETHLKMKPKYVAVILDYFFGLTVGISMIFCSLNKKTQLFHHRTFLSRLWKSAPTLRELHQNDPKMVSKHHQYMNMNLQCSFGLKHLLTWVLYAISK